MGAAAAGSWPLIAAMIGSQAIGGLTAPEGQELQSFEGTNNDPGKLMSAVRPALFGHLNRVLEDADTPVQSETTVNPIPGFAGGGLPFALSVPGMDRRRLEGMTGQEPTASGGMPIGRRRLNPETPQVDQSAIGGRTSRQPTDRVATPRGEEGDLDQLQAAIELALKAGRL